uniref:FBD domain-containing protein n=1 Tax=Globodera pallida TaxID=36090 RepID=A0A183BSE1_GLOPA
MFFINVVYELAFLFLPIGTIFWPDLQGAYPFIQRDAPVGGLCRGMEYGHGQFQRENEGSFGYLRGFGNRGRETRTAIDGSRLASGGACPCPPLSFLPNDGLTVHIATTVLDLLHLADYFQVDWERCDAHLVNCAEIPLLQRFLLVDGYRLAKMKDFFLRSLSIVRLKEFMQANRGKLSPSIGEKFSFELSMRLSESKRVRVRRVSSAESAGDSGEETGETGSTRPLPTLAPTTAKNGRRQNRAPTAPPPYIAIEGPSDEIKLCEMPRWAAYAGAWNTATGSFKENLRERCDIHLVNCAEIPLIQRFLIVDGYRLAKMKDFFLRSLSIVRLKEFMQVTRGELSPSIGKKFRLSCPCDFLKVSREARASTEAPNAY